MNPTITASLISALAALVVCMVNNHFQTAKSEKAHQDNIVLISYRLEELEKKVDKFNNLVERTFKLEQSTARQWDRIDEIKSDIAEIKATIRGE